jgi:hypothetical protein
MSISPPKLSDDLIEKGGVIRVASNRLQYKKKINPFIFLDLV